MSTPAGWAGAVLCGGASRRMGRDKALVEVDGQPLALRVARALTLAGAEEVVGVGGAAAALQEHGLEMVADDRPGEGPFGGVLTALRRAEPSHPVVFVASCDLVSPDPVAIVATVEALAGQPSAEVAVPLDGEERPQWLHAAWRTGVWLDLAAPFEAGERALHRAVSAAGLAVVELHSIAAAALGDADVPGDLPPSAGRAG